MLELTKIRVGISVGDPNGIGFEIILKTFQDEQIYDFFIPIVFQSQFFFQNNNFKNQKYIQKNRNLEHPTNAFLYPPAWTQKC